MYLEFDWTFSVYRPPINARTAEGLYLVHLPRAVVQALSASRGPRETYSEVILRFVKEQTS